MAHMVSWFQESDQCPTGCGCPCIEAGIQLAKDVEILWANKGSHESHDKGGMLIGDDDEDDFQDMLENF